MVLLLKFILTALMIVKSVTTTEIIQNFIENILENETLAIHAKNEKYIKLINKKPSFITNLSTLEEQQTNTAYIIETTTDQPPTTKWNLQTHSKFLILLPKESKLSETKNIVKQFWNMNVYKLVVHLMETEDFYVFEPYSDCNEEVVLTKFICCSNDPYKEIKNLNGCSLRVSWTYHKNFAEDPLKPSGFLPLIVSTFASTINATIRVLYEDDFLNHFVFGQDLKEDLEKFTRNKVDIILSILPIHTKRIEQFDMMPTVYSMRFIWLVPPQQEIGNWRKLFYIFSVTTWLGLVMISVVSAVVFSRITNKKITECLLLVLSMVLNMSAKLPNLNIRAHLFLSLYMIYSFHVNLAYVGSLSSFLTRPMLTPKIDSIEMIKELNLKITTVPKLSEDILLDDKLAKLLVPVKTIPTELLATYLENPDHVTFIPDLELASIKQQRKPPTLESNVKATGHCSLPVRKGFPLTNNFYRFCQTAFESGLSMKWLDDSLRMKETLVLKSLNFSVGRPLDLERVEGAFLILITGYFIATLVFCFEIRSRIVCALTAPPILE